MLSSNSTSGQCPIRALVFAAASFFCATVPAAAEVPVALLGNWSTDQNDCQGQGDTTIFGINRAEIGWYEIDCRIMRSRPTRDGVFLKVDCIKGAGATGTGDIDIRIVDDNSIDVYVSPMNFSGEFTYRLKRCSRNVAQSAQTSPTSRWSHNGSIVYLVADGSKREFRYETPRPGMIDAGARHGALLFAGSVNGDTYEGAAYVFNKRCGKVDYPVSGPILDGYRRVVLRGQAPKVDAACRIVGTITDTLEFDLIGD